MSVGNPLFSVVISTYNHEKYIAGTINSVLGQTMQDFEIIVIDDGSPDNTKNEVLRIRDERIRYFRQKPSGLPAFSRNRGIEYARGRYIALLDGDDIWLPEKLENVYKIFSDNKNIDVICHGYEAVDKDMRVIKCVHFGPYPDDIYRKLLLENNCFGISMTVLKREVFFDHNFWFDEDKRLFTVEDYDFWLRLAKSTKFRFYYLSEILARHVIAKESAILSNIERNALNMLYVFEKNASNLDEKQTAVIKKRKASIMRSAALSCNYNGDFVVSSKWFLKAIKECPYNIKSYAGILLSLFNVRMGKI